MSLARADLDHPSGDLRVFISSRKSRCDECGEDLGRRAMIFLAGDRGALCRARKRYERQGLLVEDRRSMTSSWRPASSAVTRDRVREDVDRVLSRLA